MADPIHDQPGCDDDASRVTMCFSMQCGKSALAGERRAALEAAVVVALRKVVSDFGASEFRLGRTRVGPSVDTMQRVLPFVLERLELDGAAKCFQVCKTWGQQLEAKGFCNRTFQLCSSLAANEFEDRSYPDSDNTDDKMRKLKRPAQHALQRLNATTGEAEREVCLDRSAFLQRSWGGPEWKGGLHEWLQAASQEPAASFLSRGAASTAQFLGLPLVQWVGKPEERHPVLCTLGGNPNATTSAAWFPDGKRIVTGGWDHCVKIWNAETGAKVRSFVGDVVGCVDGREEGGGLQLLCFGSDLGNGCRCSR